MSEQMIVQIELIFFGLVAIFFLVLLSKAQQIVNLLKTIAENGQVAVNKHVEPQSVSAKECTNEEIAAVMGVIAKLMPDKKVASIKLVV